MFSVDGLNITLSRGETGAVTIKSGVTDWAPEDRALLTVKNSAGAVVLKQIHKLDAAGDFVLKFNNSTTDTWPVGVYSYDVRYIVQPSYNGDFDIVDGQEVITPMNPATITIKNTVGEV